jgi:hypothetical protein
MKLKSFNYVILGLAIVSIIGYFIFEENKLFLASSTIFGVWFVINGVEHLIRNRIKDEPIKMVKE